MSTLRVTLEPVTRERAAPGEAAVQATIVNAGDRAELFHEFQARHGSLVLQVEDPSGRRVLMPPPPLPDERDLAPATALAPGASVTFTYSGFLDARRESGRYRVRWFSSHEYLGGSPRSPLASDWVAIEVTNRDFTRLDPKAGGFLSQIYVTLRTWVKRLVQGILVSRCRAVIDVELDRYITETITNGTPASWNNTYGWNARFHVRLDQPHQQIVVTIRVRLTGIAPSAAGAWVTTVQNAWSNRFKDCAVLGCADNGYPILLSLHYVTSGEHHAVSLASGRTAHMLSWGLPDGDQAHEAGHMLGNKEEYFTIDGVDYGQPHQPGGNIMNNPANAPVAAHYWLVQTSVDALLGITYSLAGGSIRSVDTPCRYF